MTNILAPAATIKTTLTEPLRVLIVSTTNFRVDRMSDPEAEEVWYEVVLGVDHTVAEHVAAMTYLPPFARVQDHDLDDVERTYFYSAGV